MQKYFLKILFNTEVAVLYHENVILMFTNLGVLKQYRESALCLYFYIHVLEIGQ